MTRAHNKKVMVAMSGGVDSSVAAALMVEEGYDVTGVMLKLWKGDDINNSSGCCSVGAADDARRVADVLDIPFYVLNFSERFGDTVVADFHSAYGRGETPNPCVRCNQWVKFGALLDRARSVGADALVTGHYARRRSYGDRYALLRGLDPRKDQSYVLWMLDQDDLAHCLFPVGEMHKSETRAIAADLGLRTAAKPDSQEICFVRNGDMDAYVDERMSAAAVPGAIVDRHGNTIGRHRGIGHYTVGQRKGLGVALGRPVFVTSIEAARNEIVIGPREQLAVGGFEGVEATFVNGAPGHELRVLVQHRAHGEIHPATVTPSSTGHLRVSYDDPVEAVAPGQSAAFYDGDEMLGGAIISTTRAAVPAAS